ELDDAAWVVTLRTGFMGHLSHHPLPYDGPSRVAGLQERFGIAFATKAGKLNLDLGSRRRHLLDETVPAAADAKIARVGLLNSRITV
ncbi:hypothetical protein, partial [Salmonella sp. SAL4355]|uniref:hypothetical protein n=1 Tax=Salmonella sp. SAL4355 TaxID=3159876 RepID=UPI00397AB7BE